MKNPLHRPDHRQIGAGVVVAHATTIAGIVVLVIVGGLDPLIGLLSCLAVFGAVFVGDHAIQWYDMNGRMDDIEARAAGEEH